MECKICGAVVPGNSTYCPKCGRKIDEIGIRARDISYFLKEKMNAADATEIQQYCKMFIDKVCEQKFKSVEIHRSSVEGTSLKDMIHEDKEGRLHIECQNSEDYLKLATAFFINEIDCRQTELNGIRRASHDDRMAKLRAAYTQYKRAMLTEDVWRKVKQLDEASTNCILGMNELKREINSNLELFAELPKSTVKKLFCGISLQEVEEKLREMQETFPWYCDAIRLLVSIDIQNKEVEKLNVTIAEEGDFLKQMIKSKGYLRLLEVDEDNAKVWNDYVNQLNIDMFFVEKIIETDTITLKILEERYE